MVFTLMADESLHASFLRMGSFFFSRLGGRCCLLAGNGYNSDAFLSSQWKVRKQGFIAITGFSLAGASVFDGTLRLAIKLSRGHLVASK